MSHDLFDGYNAQLARRGFVLDRVRRQPLRYREGFLEWLEENFPIWERFEKEANAIYALGRRRYGSRTIWEYMRHETALREKNSEFKLNDHWPPYLARLYLAIYPEREGFFLLRESGNEEAA